MYIRYKVGYRYQLQEQFCIAVPFDGEHRGKLISLVEGTLVLEPGYAWDGPSGPTFDTLSFMRASLVHDALYQLMRLGVLDQDCREPADELMRKLCLEDRMSRVRAWYTFQAVRAFGARAASTDRAKQVMVAPRGD
jgi:hypothetical protein